MNFIYKFKKAIYLYKSEGMFELIKKIKKKCINNKQTNESKMIFKVLNKYKTRGLMIDVGAHFGGALKPFANKGWHIFAFEPDKKNRNKLKESFGNFKNVIVDPRGVSEYSQRGIPLYRSEESSGISTLSAFHESHVEGDVINITNLTEYCSEKEIDQVDFLKIDTEGFDFFVLKGFPWNKINPQAILCEFENKKTLPLGYTFHDLANFLQKMEYKIIVSEWYPIKRYGGLHDWRCFKLYPCELHDTNAWGNIIAIKSLKIYTRFVQLYCNNIK